MQTQQQQQPAQQQQLPQLIVEVDSDIHAKLVKLGLLKPGAKSRAAGDKKTLVDNESAQLFESGVALAQYLIAIKETLLKRGVTDWSSIDTQKLSGLKNLIGPQTKMFNWNIIIHELDKINVKTDLQAKIVNGDQEAILSLFRKLNFAVTKLTGQTTFEIDENALKSLEENGLNRRSSVGKMKKRVAKEGVDILSMKVERDPEETESSLELILNLLCKAFAMKPKQAAALLTNNNQFLIHSIVKGVKGNYEPLLGWYADIKKHMKHLIFLLEIETEQLPKLGNIGKVQATLASGMFSQNVEICRQSFDVLIEMNQEFSTNQPMFKQAHGWVIEKEGGFDLALQALKRHADLASDFINFVTRFSSIMNHPIEKIYRDDFRNKLFQDPHEYICVINEILPYLVKHQNTQVRDSGLLDYWIDLGLEQAGLDAQKSSDERISALTLLSEIWISYTEYVDKKGDRTGFIQQVLKKAGRDRQRNLRIIAISLMFRLLDKFADEKNSAAPSIYKALIFSLIENPADLLLREHYFQNFTYLFENHNSIPLNLLMDPLIKQITISENVTYFYKVFDFDFFTVLAKHPKLTPSNAVSLADLLAKIYLNDVVLSSAASVPLMLLCSRFLQDEAMLEFITKFETICLASLMNLEKNAEELQKQHQQVLQEREMAKLAAQGKKPLALPAPPEFEHKHGKPTKRMNKEEQVKLLKEQDQEATRRLKKSLIIQILLKLQNLKHDDLNDSLKELLLSSNRRFHQNLYGYFNKGIMTLLRYWGDADILMGEYMRDQDEQEEQYRREQAEREAKQKEERDRRDKEERQQLIMRRYGEEMLKLRAQLDKGAILSEDEEKRLSLWEEKGEADFGNDSDPNVRDSMALMLYQGSSRLNAATMRNQKAMQQIDKIYRSKIEQEEQKKLDEERQKLTSQRRKQKLKELLDKRKLELGVGSKTEEIPNKEKLIYDQDGTEQDSKKKVERGSLPEIKLLNLDEEEDRDREAMTLIMKKYSKLWKNLYYKYSNSGFNSKNVANFDQYNEKSQTISLGEMTKLLKDHNVFPNLINKDELQTLFRLINTKLFKKQELVAMDYPAYYQLIMQLAYFCFTRDPQNLSHLPMVETVNGLIKTFENATRARGNSTVLFEDPDATSASDAKLIKALNDKLKADPQYPIPEGFMKQMERTPVFDYHIPQQVAAQMKPSKVIVLETLDQILSEKFGFHLLEPIVKYEERLKVKPQIKMVNSQIKDTTQAEALTYMKKVERRKPSEGGNTLNPYASMSALEKLKLQQEVKPELSTTLKLEVAQAPIKDRNHVQEVAEVLEEILSAADKGLLKLPPRANRAPGQVWNEAKQKKEEDQKREKEIHMRQESKRRKRDERLKSELVKIKEIRDKEEEEKKKKEKEDKEKKKETAKKAEETIKKKMETARVASLSKPINELAKKAEEEKSKKKLEDMGANGKPKEPVDLEKAKSERRAFMRRQKERMSLQFDQMIKEREEVVKKQELVSAKEKELQQKIRQSMEAHVKETAPDRGKEQRERKQIIDFLAQEDVQTVFYRYDQALRQMFKFYASQDKKDVGFNLERAMNSMNMRELIRFSYQQLIIPSLLQPEDIVQIFRQIIREKQGEVQASIQDKEDNYLVDQNFAQIIEYDQFKKVLVRIATLAATDNHAGGINTKIDSETANKKKAKKEKKDPLKLNEDAVAKEDAFMDKMQQEQQKKKATIASQRSRSQVKNTPVKASTQQTSNTQVAEAQSPIKSGGATIANSSQKEGPMLNALTNSLRISKEVKILRALEEKEQFSNNLLAQAKIDKDRKVRKEFNVSLIQAKTIEALLRFMELEPEEKPQSLDQKLNQHRIEIQGQKPNRIKRQLKNNKLEDYIQELPAEEGENTMYGGRNGALRGGAGSTLEDGEVLQREDTVAAEEEEQ